MDKDSKFTRDEDGYVAVRTVSAPYSSGSDDKDSMFTRDEDGYIAVRVTGSGGGSGGDQHNLGWYATESALTTAYPTATDGDWAIIGATDTVWVWDTDTTAWKDTGAAGIELPSQTGNAGKFLVTNGTSASWDTSVKQLQIKASSALHCDFIVSSPTGGGTGVFFQSGQGSNVQLGGNFLSGLSFVSKLYVREIYYGSNNSQGITVPSVGGTLALQIATLPTAGSTYEGTIYQYTGATDSAYTNGHFYKCVSDGQTPATYSWEEISFGDVLPSQTGNSGKFLTTNGTSPSWSDKPLVNNTTASSSIAIFGSVASYYASSIAIGHSSSSESTGIAIGGSTYASDSSVCVGNRANSQACGVSVGKDSQSAKYSIAIGLSTRATGQNSIQIGMNSIYGTTNPDANTMKVANANGNFEMMSADGTIPTARLTKVNSTITLTSAGWSSNTQTVNVTGMTATGLVFVSPDPTDQSAYTSAGIICSAQAAGTLTFTCTTTPSADIDVNVVML